MRVVFHRFKFIVLFLTIACSHQSSNSRKIASTGSVTCIAAAYGFLKSSRSETRNFLIKIKEWIFLPSSARKFNEEQYFKARTKYLSMGDELTLQKPRSFSQKLALLDATLMSLQYYKFIDVKEGILDKREISFFIENFKLKKSMRKADLTNYQSQLMDILHGQEFSLIPGQNPSYKQWLSRMFETNMLHKGSFAYLKKFKLNDRFTLGDMLRFMYRDTKVKWMVHTLKNILLLPFGMTPKLNYLKMSELFLDNYSKNGLNYALEQSSLLTKIKFNSHFAYQKYRKQLGVAIVATDIYLIYLALNYNLELERQRADAEWANSLKTFKLRDIQDILENTAEVKKKALLEEIISDFIKDEGRQPTAEELKIITEIIQPSIR